MVSPDLVTTLPDTPASPDTVDKAPPPSFKKRLTNFAGKPIGYGVLIALIVLVVAGSLYYVGVLLGAIVLLLMGFGFPIYLGWNRSFRNLWILALVITIAAPPIWGALATNELFTPYSPPNSSDPLLSGSVLQGAHVDPFSYPPASGNSYHFEINAARQNHNATPINLTAVYLWVTDCPYDGAGTQNACGGNPDYYQTYPYVIQPANVSRPTDTAYFNRTLPANEVFYYVFTANYTINIYTANHTLKGNGYSYACLGYCSIVQGIAQPTAQQNIYWNEGPITGSWATIYGTKLLPGYYLVMAGLGGLLGVIILIYRFLKMRERRRHEEAGAAATGTVSSGETRCPQCSAVVKPGESFCWKCGGSLESPAPNQPLPVK